MKKLLIVLFTLIGCSSPMTTHHTSHQHHTVPALAMPYAPAQLHLSERMFCFKAPKDSTCVLGHATVSRLTYFNSTPGQERAIDAGELCVVLGGLGIFTIDVTTTCEVGEFAVLQQTVEVIE